VSQGRRGRCAEFVFRVFAASSRNVSCGLEKLGLNGCRCGGAAQYHYLSNWMAACGESLRVGRKAWIRIRRPAGSGAHGDLRRAREVSRAMLRGWHANTAYRSAIPKLVLFAPSRPSMQDGLEGYYYEYDHALDVDQRLVFARHLEARCLIEKAPALPVSSWPKPRWKSLSQLCDEYVRTGRRWQCNCSG